MRKFKRQHLKLLELVETVKVCHVVVNFLTTFYTITSKNKNKKHWMKWLNLLFEFVEKKIDLASSILLHLMPISRVGFISSKDVNIMSVLLISEDSPSWQCVLECTGPGFVPRMGVIGFDGFNNRFHMSQLDVLVKYNVFQDNWYNPDVYSVALYLHCRGRITGGHGKAIASPQFLSIYYLVS